MNPHRQQIWDEHGGSARLALESSGVEDAVVFLIDPSDKQGRALLRARGGEGQDGQGPVNMVVPREEAASLLSFAPKAAQQVGISPGEVGAYAVVISGGALVVRLGPDGCTGVQV